MENKAAETVAKYNMLCQGDTVVIGVSGGADSCALFHFLLSIRERMNLRLIVCHVNHMLRGKEADRDETFVRELCGKNDVEFRLLKIDVAGESKKRKLGTEQCGRDIRYTFFEEIAKESDAKIATAHTASDNAETVILNLTRGCGVRGLCGIPPVRDHIIRPLIEVTRDEVEEYCRNKGFAFVTDSTNLTREYTRNKIRLDVIPILKTINPAFERTITRMSENSRCNVNYLYSQANNALSRALVQNKFEKIYKAEILYSLDEAVFAEAVSIMAQEFGVTPEAKHIKLIRDIARNSGAVEIKDNIYAVSEQGYLRIIKKKDTIVTEPVPFVGCKTVVISDKKFTVSKMKIDEFHNRKKNSKFLFHNSLDYDTIPMSALFRCRKSGDVFRPPKRNVTKTLKKLFNELKIPKEQRDSIIVLADGSDILWIEGIGADAEHQVDSNTRNVALIEWDL
ncbi:MAG: tRNA lysidine(34) synthetase TilS [Clostridia bacterium]|nr:tRNA lysidine(34) synthetase TilS [Clostridia bacterium]